MKETFKDTETKQMRAVKAGEELTCDYGFDPNNQVIIIIIKFIVNIYRFFSCIYSLCRAGFVACGRRNRELFE